MTAIKQEIRTRDTLGASALRPDGVAKVTGSFSFSSDMWAENMLWGATLRSPHPYARIISIDTTEALLIIARSIARIAFALLKKGCAYDPQHRLRIACAGT
jgi:CO/xanthine dehydrogenase Mo-binding subunit